MLFKFPFRRLLPMIIEVKTTRPNGTRIKGMMSFVSALSEKGRSIELGLRVEGTHAVQHAGTMLQAIQYVCSCESAPCCHLLMAVEDDGKL